MADQSIRSVAGQNHLTAYLGVLFSRSADFMICLDANYDILDVTSAVLHYYEWDRDNLINKNFLAFINTQIDRKNFNTVIKILANSDAPKPKSINADQWDADKIKNTEGEVIGWMLFRDAQQSDSSNTSMQSFLDYLAAISSLMPGNFYWKDKDGHYLGCNDALLQTLELTRNALVGKTDFDLWPDQAKQLLQHDSLVMRTGQLVRLEEEVAIKNKGKRFFTVVKIPMRDDKDNIVGVIGNSIDITAQVELQRKLNIEKKQVEAANQAKTEFIANMSHDIRTPMTGILGLAQSLARNTESTVGQDHARMLIAASEELLILFNEILEVVEIESGKIKYSEYDFDLYALIKHNTNLLEPTAYEKKINFTTHIDPNVPQYIVGNRICLNRILLNLLSNSFKFTQSGDVTISVSLKQDDKNQHILKLIVEDTGIGIPKDKFTVIFENFSRLTPSYQGIYKGSGLGLYMVKQYLDAMNGTITLESQVGEGARFCVSIPVGINTGKAINLHAGAFDTPLSDKQTTQLSNLRIMLIEDHPLAAKMAANLLTNLGCTVEISNTGSDAIKKANSGNFDLIYMDIGLPDMDGFEITKQLRQSENQKLKKLPIIALTGHMTDQERERCLQAGMQDLFTKPLTEKVAKFVLKKWGLLDG